MVGTRTLKFFDHPKGGAKGFWTKSDLIFFREMETCGSVCAPGLWSAAHHRYSSVGLAAHHRGRESLPNSFKGGGRIKV
jgi:hypothetical protein